MNDDLWYAVAHKDLDSILFIGCLEMRLGRTLRRSDFPKMPVNFARRMGPRSARFKNRLKAPRSYRVKRT